MEMFDWWSNLLMVGVLLVGRRGGGAPVRLPPLSLRRSVYSHLPMRFFFYTTALLLLAFAAPGVRYPQDAFRSPVDHEIRLSGTFGELRSNHFHAGIDIKSSNGRTGDPLYAIADATVARVKVQAGGYGNALYLRHPNGYTSVYAHLDSFDPALAKYVKAAQYERREFEVDLYPPAGKFTYAQGQQIGRMGTSGRSFGPHLHFEIRDSGTEKLINPLLFGFKIADQRAPKMHALKVYSLNDARQTVAERTVPLVGRGREYGVAGDTLTINAWRAGFGLRVFDHHDKTNNWNGIYKLRVLQDEQPIHGFEMETFAFSETRYINALSDYAEKVTNKSDYNRTYRLPGNRLSVYRDEAAYGVVELSSYRPSKITMIASDVHGNERTLEFWVKRGEVQPMELPPYNYLLDYAVPNAFETGNLYAYFPENTLYETLPLRYQTQAAPTEAYYSAVHQLHEPTTPVQRYFELAIRPDRPVPAEKRDKAFVAFCGKDGQVRSNGGHWEGERLAARVRSLGDYAILLDEMPPTVRAVTFRNDMRGLDRMSFEITDNVATTGKAKGLRYAGYVDDAWVLFEYDAKKDLLTHRFDGRIGPGEHALRLVVTDDRGNERVYERTFRL